MSHFLPIGSVVLLKGAKHRVMICGRVQQAQTTGALYDYSACAFPLGYISADNMILFNYRDIETIYFVGCIDEEETRFRKLLEEKLSEQRAKQIQVEETTGVQAKEGPSEEPERETAG